MAYIGAQPRLGNFQACDAITTSATTTFNLLVGGTAIFPQSAQHCLVSLNGVLQAPISSYTISGSTIIFAAALTTDDSIDFITILGDTLDLGVPSDDTVGAAQIKADLISGTTALTAEPADTDEFLVSDAGVLKRIDYSLIKGGGITEADLWRLTSSLNANADPISSNLERVDDASFAKIGTGMSVSSGIWTFASTGIYQVTVSAGYEFNNDNANINVYATQNNSSYDLIAWKPTGHDSNHNASSVAESFVDVTDVSNVKVKFTTSGMAGGSATILKGDTDSTVTSFKFIRLGDT